jgi:hypothetical protein
MLRRIGLSLILLVSTVVLLPLASSTAHNLRVQFANLTRHHHRHHSRAWWRRHRARLRRQQAMRARRRELMASRQAGQFPASAVNKASENHVTLPTALPFPEGLYRDGALTIQLPQGWTTAANAGGSVFNIAAPNGLPTGRATLSVVANAPAANQAIGREQKRALAGVPFSELRRTVIDKMFSSGGWVVNDREREIGGHRVFQVVAQTPAANGTPDQVWNFYFAEVDGRVYSLSTRAAGELTGKLDADAESFFSAFRPLNHPPVVNK